MLAIRLQRLGRKGYPVYRLAVQESNPHTKENSIQVELAQKYLDNGAQPSPRVIKLLKDGGVKLPKWVKEPQNNKKRSIKNIEKLRKNQPKD